MSSENGFQSLLYYKFIITKQHRVEPIAKKIDVSVDNLYKIVRGADKPTRAPGARKRYEFPIDKISDLYQATKDLDFLLYFVKPCGYSLIPIFKNPAIRKAFEGLTEVLVAATGGAS